MHENSKSKKTHRLQSPKDLFHYAKANIEIFMNGGYHYPYYFNKTPNLTNNLH